jgi:hypothetical protein
VGHRGPVYKGLGAMNPCDNLHLRDCRVVEEHVSGSKSCTMAFDTIEVSTFGSGDATSQLRTEVKVGKNNFKAILLSKPMYMMKLEGKIKLNWLLFCDELCVAYPLA